MVDKIEYYKIRLEHTLKHTQEATRLIYLVNAGILGLIAFLWEKTVNLQNVAPSLTFLALAILAVINLLHALFILRQGLWYKDLKDSYWRLIRSGEENEIDKPTLPKFLNLPSTDLFAYIHFLIFFGVLIAMVMMARNH